MIRFLLSLALVLFGPTGLMSQYAPPAGEPGSTAIHADSSIIVAWASACTIDRGPLDISQPSIGLTSYGQDTDGVGAADNMVVSLGDGGMAKLKFDNPIKNGQGPDFAVFENTIWADFLELCFVEVSSDNSTFHRFPAISLTQTDSAIGSFGLLNATKLHNLGGKYELMYGVPFDLEDLAGTVGLDINHVTHVQLVDVVGSLDASYASYDSQGKAINDPWPTAFESCGFDLDAVGVIHEDVTNVEDAGTRPFKIYPQPANDYLQISNKDQGRVSEYNFFDPQGRLIKKSWSRAREFRIDVSDLRNGFYMLQIVSEGISFSQKILIQKS
jgi:hypothetical protein